MRAKPILLILFAVTFFAALIPPDSSWLMAIGLGGFIASCFLPKDF